MKRAFFIGAHARALYEKNGYKAETRIRDFYGDGANRIAFHKKLTL